MERVGAWCHLALDDEALGIPGDNPRGILVLAAHVHVLHRIGLSLGLVVAPFGQISKGDSLPSCADDVPHVRTVVRQHNDQVRRRRHGHRMQHVALNRTTDDSNDLGGRLPPRGSQFFDLVGSHSESVVSVLAVGLLDR